MEIKVPSNSLRTVRLVYGEDGRKKYQSFTGIMTILRNVTFWRGK